MSPDLAKEQNTSYLNDGVEPGQDEVKSSALVRRPHHSCRRNRSEGSQEVGAHARRWFERDDPASTKQVNRKFRCDLTGQEKPARKNGKLSDFKHVIIDCTFSYDDQCIVICLS